MHFSRSDRMGFGVIELVLVLLVLILGSGVAYVTIQRIATRSHAGRQTAAVPTVLTFFPNSTLSYRVPEDWSVVDGKNANEEGTVKDINSPEQVMVKNICPQPQLVGADGKPVVTQCNPPMFAEPAVTVEIVSPAPDDNPALQRSYTQLGKLQALCRAPSQLETSFQAPEPHIPPDLPSDMPAAVFVDAGCQISSGYNTYSISVRLRSDASASQVYALLRSLSFVVGKT